MLALQRGSSWAEALFIASMEMKMENFMKKKIGEFNEDIVIMGSVHFELVQQMLTPLTKHIVSRHLTKV